jgi:hypothetical protein
LSATPDIQSTSKYLVDLSPFFRGLLSEALVDHGHDLVEKLAVTVSALHAYAGGCALLVEGCIGNLLQLC